MQGSVDTAKDKCERVEEDMPRDIQEAPPMKFPPTMRVWNESVQVVKVPLQRKQPLVKHAPRVRESASS